MGPGRPLAPTDSLRTANTPSGRLGVAGKLLDMDT